MLFWFYFIFRNGWEILIVLCKTYFFFKKWPLYFLTLTLKKCNKGKRKICKCKLDTAKVRQHKSVHLQPCQWSDASLHHKRILPRFSENSGEKKVKVEKNWRERKTVILHMLLYVNRMMSGESLVVSFFFSFSFFNTLMLLWEPSHSSPHSGN